MMNRNDHVRERRGRMKCQNLLASWLTSFMPWRNQRSLREPRLSFYLVRFCILRCLISVSVESNTINLRLLQLPPGE
jgi:hypothetical protein